MTGYLSVYEDVRATSHGAERVKYLYHYVYPGGPSFGYHFDPLGHPDLPCHKHRVERDRVAWEHVSLRDALDEAIALSTEIAEMAGEETETAE